MRKILSFTIVLALALPLIAKGATGWPWWPWRVKADRITWDRGLSVSAEDEWQYIVLIPLGMKSEEMPPPSWLKDQESWKLVPIEGLRGPLIVKTPRVQQGESKSDFWEGIMGIVSPRFSRSASSCFSSCSIF